MHWVRSIVGALEVRGKHNRDMVRVQKNQPKRRILWIPLLLCILVLFGLMRIVFSAGQTKLIKEGISYLDRNMYSEAIVKFDAALNQRKNIGKKEIEILKYRAQAESMLGDLAAATHTYAILEEHHALSDELKSIYAIQLLQLGERDRAKEILENAKSQNATLYADAILLLADKYMEAKEYENALTYLSMVGEEKQAIHLRKAILKREIACYEYLGDYEEALQRAKAYIAEYGEDEKIRHEILFLESRL